MLQVSFKHCLIYTILEQSYFIILLYFYVTALNTAMSLISNNAQNLIGFLHFSYSTVNVLLYMFKRKQRPTLNQIKYFQRYNQLSLFIKKKHCINMKALNTNGETLKNDTLSIFFFCLSCFLLLIRCFFPRTCPLISNTKSQFWRKQKSYVLKSTLKCKKKKKQI